MGRVGFLLDRDGVLLDEVDYLSRAEDVRLVPGGGQCVARLNRAGMPVAVCTNQPVVARGDVTPEGLARIHARMALLLARADAHLDGLFVCPHHPDPGTRSPDARFVTTCDCRKPKAGLLWQARDALDLTLHASVYVGDRSTDILAARRAGAVPVGVLTGKHCQDARHAIPPETPLLGDLPAAVDLVLTTVASWQPWMGQVRPGSVVAVGGPSRSGKTSVSTALLLALRAAGVDAVHLSLDRWITPRSARVPGASFLERVRFGASAAGVQRLVEHGAARVPAYDPFTREAGPDEDVTRPSGAVLIVDGLMALDAAVPSDVRVFVDGDEPALRERRRAFYGWKGAGAADVVDALEGRADERAAVTATRARAHRVLRLDPAMALEEVRP